MIRTANQKDIIMEGLNLIIQPIYNSNEIEVELFRIVRNLISDYYTDKKESVRCKKYYVIRTCRICGHVNIDLDVCEKCSSNLLSKDWNYIQNQKKIFKAEEQEVDKYFKDIKTIFSNLKQSKSRNKS